MTDIFQRFLIGWHTLSGSEKRHASAMVTTIVGLNLAGWGIFAVAILPHHFRYSGLGVGIGVAFTAWTLGCRHAFDADHIAAIDNLTRKLMADGKRPLGTGFFFALGHSSIILVVGTGITIAAKSVFHAVVTPTSTFETAGGVVGTALSASFLWLIAGLNLVVFAGIVRVFRDMRKGRYSEEELEAQLQARGLMYRFFGPRQPTRTRVAPPKSRQGPTLPIKPTGGSPHVNHHPDPHRRAHPAGEDRGIPGRGRRCLVAL